ncbi:MAG: hypothetical protein L6R41_003187 [Letrouitia leprolyta]|nr:MAG: hypothetical protein L6R41_003187 [Letrouitia leprolyta]
MRLLHTGNLQFQELTGEQIPEYAILSHRWTSYEVSYQDFPLYRNHRCSSKYAKIKDHCRFARHHDFQWVWIVTCCIDKKSSAELSEAINSMYEWYKRARIYHVYLADVLMALDRHGKCNEQKVRADFRASEWFTRGWTLQELLAPTRLAFLDSDWNVIGHNRMFHKPHDKEGSQVGRLLNDISQASGISMKDLVQDPEAQCFARKMSWLSKRRTTREEDMAYCMLGLCGVNMPLLYGEGRKAFIRLQSEFIKISDDESVFAWFSTSSRIGNGILAASPLAFWRSQHVEVHRSLIGKRPYLMTNKGLQYQIPRHRSDPDTQPSVGDTYPLLLDCGVEHAANPFQVTLSVRIPLILGTQGWERDFSEDHNKTKIPLGSKKPWAEIVDKGCRYETLYISTIGSSLGRERALDLDNSSHEALKGLIT